MPRLILLQGTSCDNSFNGEDVALGRKAIDNIFGYATHNAVMMIQVRMCTLKDNSGITINSGKWYLDLRVLV